MRFTGSSKYVATQDLRVAVNAALTLERPLLVKGEPGTGKTVLAEEVAAALHAPLLTWHIKSTTKAQQGLYEYDAVSRLRDSQLGDPRVSEIGHYIKRGKLWEAFAADEQLVLLIDEIDKADIEFPNDLLLELDRMEFHVYETGETVRARKRPLVIITSNNEKELPDAFLRRCFFHYIKFPDKPTMEAIVFRLRALRSAASKPHEGTPIRVLVVEDDRATRRMITLIARKALPDAQVTEAATADEALAQLRRDTPDVILLDLHLPGMNGIELMMYLRGSGLAETSSVVAISAGAQDQDLALLHELGVYHFVRKGDRLMEELPTLLRELHRLRAPRASTSDDLLPSSRRQPTP